MIMMCMVHDLNPPRMIIGSTNSNSIGGEVEKRATNIKLLKLI
jgi:hypothetical protein